MAYFGGAFPPYHLPGARLFDAATTYPGPGLYAVSSFLLAAGPELMLFRGDAVRAAGYERLRRLLAERGLPEGRVGYSILVYRLPEERTPQP